MPSCWASQNWSDFHTAFESVAGSSPVSCHQVLSELPRTSAGGFFFSDGFFIWARAKRNVEPVQATHGQPAGGGRISQQSYDPWRLVARCAPAPGRETVCNRRAARIAKKHRSAHSPQRCRASDASRSPQSLQTSPPQHRPSRARRRRGAAPRRRPSMRRQSTRSSSRRASRPRR